jgi:xanthine dehydrogenase accessory factor
MPHVSSPNRPPLAVVLGTNEIASAVAIVLRRIGRAVILSQDPLVPVIRRGMAFHDALFNEAQKVETVTAKRAECLNVAMEVASAPHQVAITPLGLIDLLVLGALDLLVDARMHKRAVVPDFRGLARITIGLGPGFAATGNCDIAVETAPGSEGIVLRSARTAARQETVRLLGGVGAERFVYAPSQGCWRTPLDIGAKVYKGVVIGHLDRLEIRAPMDGILRGIARDGTEMPAGVKILEIDPRGRAASSTGLDESSRRIAEAVSCAILLCDATSGGQVTRRRSPALPPT